MEIKRISKITVAGMCHFDFFEMYTRVFNLYGIKHLKGITPNTRLQGVEQCLQKLAHEEDEFGSKIIFDRENGIFRHITGSGRVLEYHYRTGNMYIDFGPDGSILFASEFLQPLYILLDPSGWRGIGGGNVRADGSVPIPYTFDITFVKY